PVRAQPADDGQPHGGSPALPLGGGIQRTGGRLGGPARFPEGRGIPQTGATGATRPSHLGSLPAPAQRAGRVQRTGRVALDQPWHHERQHGHEVPGGGAGLGTRNRRERRAGRGSRSAIARTNPPPSSYPTASPRRPRSP